MATLPAGHEPGMIDALLKLSRSLLAHARMRLQLLGLELEEEKQRVFVALLSTLFAYLFLSVTLMLFALAVVIHFWDTPSRLSCVIWMALSAGLITLISMGVAVLKISRPSTLFHASLAELVEDHAELDREPPGAADAAPAAYANGSRA